MRRHLIPNMLAILIVQSTIWLSYAIILEASLSYLGLGVQIPTPSWGNMLQDGQRELLFGAWWLTLFPGLSIFLTVLPFNLLGDGLRDALDPRHRRRQGVPRAGSNLRAETRVPCERQRRLPVPRQEWRPDHRARSRRE